MNSSVVRARIVIGILAVAGGGCGREPDMVARASAPGVSAAAPSASSRSRVFTDPFGFPARPLAATPGGLVLVPSPGSLRAAADPDVEPATLAYTLAHLEKSGDVSSELKWLTEQRGTVPNAMVIPLTREGRARRGEVVLIAGMSGTGLERAVVTSDGDSATPRVRSLDAQVSRLDDSGLRELASGSFRVVAHAGDVGSTLACRVDGDFEPYLLVGVFGERWLAVGFAGRARVFEASRCRVLPVAVVPKSGARVTFPLAGRFVPGEVAAVDIANGRIRVSYEFASIRSETLVGFVNVATEALR